MLCCNYCNPKQFCTFFPLIAEYHFRFPIHINEAWLLESYFYFPPLYQVRYTILLPNGENEQLGLCVYETLENKQSCKELTLVFDHFSSLQTHGNASRSVVAALADG